MRRRRFNGGDFLVLVCMAMWLSCFAYTFLPLFMDSGRNFSFTACNSLRECRERSGMSQELLEMIDADEKLIELLSKKAKESNKEGK